MRTFVIQKLLTSHVTDPMVGHEDDEGLIQDPFFFKPLHNLTDVFIRKAPGVEICRPIAEYRRTPDSMAAD